ncbi:hypothetical protein MCOR25_003203 [Pyricularia grisea]|nr:hypothetical protein MCOR25_003203 [Pyricularia grisea]
MRYLRFRKLSTHLGKIEPHEFTVPEGVAEFEDLASGVCSEASNEGSSDGASDSLGEDDLDLEDLDSDDAEG